MIAAVIPTLYRPPTLGPLLSVLAADGVEVILIDTTGREPAIYQWWNEGVREAQALGASHVAILNDDILVAPGTMAHMAAVLDANPDLGCVYPQGGAAHVPESLAAQRTEGLWHSAAGLGMVGWCFMIPADLGIPFDERYRWWAGDDAFEESVRRAGRTVGCAVGLYVEHLESYSSPKRWDDLQPLVDADRAIWYGPERWA